MPGRTAPGIPLVENGTPMMVLININMVLINMNMV